MSFVYKLVLHVIDLHKFMFICCLLLLDWQHVVRIIEIHVLYGVSKNCAVCNTATQKNNSLYYLLTGDIGCLPLSRHTGRV